MKHAHINTGEVSPQRELPVAGSSEKPWRVEILCTSRGYLDLFPIYEEQGYTKDPDGMIGYSGVAAIPSYPGTYGEFEISVPSPYISIDAVQVLAFMYANGVYTPSSTPVFPESRTAFTFAAAVTQVGEPELTALVDTFEVPEVGYFFDFRGHFTGPIPLSYLSYGSSFGATDLPRQEGPFTLIIEGRLVADGGAPPPPPPPAPVDVLTSFATTSGLYLKPGSVLSATDGKVIGTAIGFPYWLSAQQTVKSNDVVAYGIGSQTWFLDDGGTLMCYTPTDGGPWSLLRAAEGVADFMSGFIGIYPPPTADAPISIGRADTAILYVTKDKKIGVVRTPYAPDGTGIDDIPSSLSRGGTRRARCVFADSSDFYRAYPYEEGTSWQPMFSAVDESGGLHFWGRAADAAGLSGKVFNFPGAAQICRNYLLTDTGMLYQMSIPAVGSLSFSFLRGGIVQMGLVSVDPKEARSRSLLMYIDSEGALYTEYSETVERNGIKVQAIEGLPIDDSGFYCLVYKNGTPWSHILEKTTEQAFPRRGLNVVPRDPYAGMSSVVPEKYRYVLLAKDSKILGFVDSRGRSCEFSWAPGESPDQGRYRSVPFRGESVRPDMTLQLDGTLWRPVGDAIIPAEGPFIATLFGDRYGVTPARKLVAISPAGMQVPAGILDRTVKHCFSLWSKLYTTVLLDGGDIHELRQAGDNAASLVANHPTAEEAMAFESYTYTAGGVSTNFTRKGACIVRLPGGTWEEVPFKGAALTGCLNKIDTSDIAKLRYGHETLAVQSQVDKTKLKVTSPALTRISSDTKFLSDTVHEFDIPADVVDFTSIVAIGTALSTTTRMKVMYAMPDGSAWVTTRVWSIPYTASSYTDDTRQVLAPGSLAVGLLL